MLQNFKVFFQGFITLAVISLPASLFAEGVPPGFGGPLVITFAHAVTESSPKGQMALKFKSLLEKSMEGRIEVEVYPNSEMLDDNKIFEGLLLDHVQMGAPSLSKFSIYTKKLQLFDLPFLFKDLDAVEKFQQSKEGEELLTSFRNRGILGLGYLHNGLKQLSATEMLAEPKDAEGLKFRIMSSDVLEAQFTAVGAEAVKKPFSQVYSLLSTGVIEGQENTWTNIYSKKFHTVQPYITESNHGVLEYMVVTSVTFWDNLLDDEKVAIKSALKEAIAYGNDLARKETSKAKSLVVKSGKTEVVELTPAQRAKWVKAMKPVWAKFQDDIGKDLIDKALKSN